MKASDATPAINTRVKFEQWMEFIAAIPPLGARIGRNPAEASLRLQFERFNNEITYLFNIDVSGGGRVEADHILAGIRPVRLDQYSAPFRRFRQGEVVTAVCR
jgi:hypothetical protein